MVIEPRDRHIDGLTNDATPGASDHQQIAGTRARAFSSSFCPRSFLLALLSLSLSRSSAIICYVRDSKLTAILASCHSYVLPFVSPVDPERLPVAPGRVKPGILHPIGEGATRRSDYRGQIRSRSGEPSAIREDFS